MKIFRNNSRIYLLLNLSLLLVFCCISLYEIITTIINGKESINFFTAFSFKFINHFFTVLLIFTFFFPFYYLLNKVKKKLGKFFIIFIFILLVLIEYSLTKYSLTTLLNLGADLLGYSFDDIVLTVSSSESTSLLYYLAFLLFPLLFVIVHFLSKKVMLKRKYLIVLLAISFIVICVKFIFSNISESNFQNKTYYFLEDVIKFKINKANLKTDKFKDDNEYPLLKPSDETKDVLGPFFNHSKQKPNIVLIIVEGLGTEFVDGNSYSGFTPYLDSLIPKSLYWQNFVSNAGRTFGALPSITGSLPFGENGFLEIPKTPAHISLFSVLKDNNYTTSFYGGDKSSFDKKINYLEYNGVDNVIDEKKYDSSYPKSVNESNGFSWGYSDNEIFEKALTVFDDLKLPRLDVIATQTIHEPFTFPIKDIYLTKVDSILNNAKNLKSDKNDFLVNKDIFASILYADNSLKKFMEAYKKRKEYSNTVFIITGDHRLIPISQKDKLCRFNVPLYIFSPMLKRASRIKSISSHFDVTPSLLSFLSNNYNVQLPEKTAFVGKGLDTVTTFRNIKNIPLMRYKGGLNDFLYKEYLYSDGTIFEINEDFNIYKVSNNNVLEEATKAFNKFKNINAYVTEKDKIYPKEFVKSVVEKYKFTEEELKQISSLTKGLSLNEIFNVARENAFNDKREIARLLCNYILSTEPNYVDVILLKARTLGWERKYEDAEKSLLNALKRAPYYYDVYLASLDMYWWSSQNEKAIKIYEKAKKNKVDNDEIAFKMARAYESMGKIENAHKIIDSILKKQPKNVDFIKFKNALK